MKNAEKTFICSISGLPVSSNEKVSAKTLKPALIEFIQKEHPDFKADSILSMQSLNSYRYKFMTSILEKGLGELGHMEQTVISKIREHDTLTDKLDKDENAGNAPTTVGQRVADKVASFGGSWTFIISFGIFILIWISINVFVMIAHPFDPYPFILLNLILSCLAALQAPVIMMSQNRQEEKDRERAKKDYMINLKSELEIRLLHEKIDHLILHQQNELLEIQALQVEMMNDILQQVRNK